MFFVTNRTVHGISMAEVVRVDFLATYNQTDYTYYLSKRILRFKSRSGSQNIPFVFGNAFLACLVSYLISKTCSLLYFSNNGDIFISSLLLLPFAAIGNGMFSYLDYAITLVPSLLIFIINFSLGLFQNWIIWISDICSPFIFRS